MNHRCSLSIVMPAYNVENYIGAALESLKNQTESPDEIILINDGSCDATIEVANSFSFSCPFKIVSTENKGQGPARNLGVSLSISQYIYFFDSDDILAPNFVEIIKDNIEKSVCLDILFFSGESFNDEGYQTQREINYKRGFEGEFSSPVSIIEAAKSFNGLVCSPCLYVSKKSLWGEGRLQFKGHFLEDNALFYPLLFSCKSIKVIDDILFFRRNRAGSTMTMKPNKKHAQGALNCLSTTINLYYEIENSYDKKKYITEKVKGFSLYYIIYCRKAGEKTNFFYLLKSLKITKSPLHGVKILIFLFRLNESYFLKSIVKRVRAFKS
ncbi:glycosyltransferase family 2 protein [Pistricoccus aurantiacus]|uniref:glycosyltransferase family 2 protein n=1 Tax=Pistricoccus aurantiacus TaxID=1883414 RepID=UPI00363C13B5